MPVEKSKLMPIEENFHVYSCEKNCILYPYLSKVSVNSFFLENNFNCDSKNLIYVVICKGCKKRILVRLAVW